MFPTLYIYVISFIKMLKSEYLGRIPVANHTDLFTQTRHKMSQWLKITTRKLHTGNKVHFLTVGQLPLHHSFLKLRRNPWTSYHKNGPSKDFHLILFCGYCLLKVVFITQLSVPKTLVCLPYVWPLSFKRRCTEPRFMMGCLSKTYFLAQLKFTVSLMQELAQLARTAPSDLVILLWKPLNGI